MNVRQIVKQFLLANGYDGLYNDDCGCALDDLIPCGSESLSTCEPGYKIPCDPETCSANGDCPWHIGPSPAMTAEVEE